MKRTRFTVLTINQTLIISHIVLVLMLVLGMSWSRFSYEWKLHLEQASHRAEDALLYHVKDLSLLVAGRNYSTIMLPSKIEALFAHKNLLFLDIEGISDNQSQLVHVRYLREERTIWREDISENDIKALNAVKLRLEKLLEQTPEGDVEKRLKLGYIIEKSALDYNQGVASLLASQQFNTMQEGLIQPGELYHFDDKRYHLHMSVPLRNEKGGRLWGVFDVSELASTQQELLGEIILEAILALFISLILIFIVTRKLVEPIQNLSKHMSKEVDSIYVEEIKERHRGDEIGTLARDFIRLISKIQSQVSDLKQKSDTDALTGLGSRHQYAYQAAPLLKKSLLSGLNFSLLICDIDNFKAFNDSYGHTEGDRVIQSVAEALLSTLNADDKCYRIGGDEFVILLAGYVRDEHIIKAEKIRQAVERLNIEQGEHSIQHMVSISVGMSFIEANDCNSNLSRSCVFDELFNKADQQLYLAKSRGRNNVVSAKFILRAHQ